MIALALVMRLGLGMAFAEAPAQASEAEKPIVQASAAKSKKQKAESHNPEAELEPAVDSARAHGSASDSVCLGSTQVINELKAKQKQLDDREKELGKQTEELKTKEQILLEEFGKLTKLREEVQSLQLANKKMSEESILRMVDTVEKMSPKAAAQLLTKVNEPLAVETIARISTVKLAKVLSSMDVAKASSLTEGLTRRGTKREGSI